MTHQTLSIRFPKAPGISPDELRKLVNGLPNGSHPLLHNHREDDMDYPLVQYRDIACKPAIWAMDEGIEAVLSILDQLPPSFRVNNPRYTDYVPYKKTNLIKYKCESFLPLNEENHDIWKSQISFVRRVQLVEDIIKQDIGNFLRKVGLKINGLEVNVILNALKPNGTEEVSGSGNTMDFLSFTPIFFTDFVLPIGLGLGKFKAKGHGITLPM